MRILGEDLQGFVNLWERIWIRKDLQDFGRGFEDFGSRIATLSGRIETLGEDLQGYLQETLARICKDL